MGFKAGFQELPAFPDVAVWQHLEIAARERPDTLLAFSSSGRVDEITVARLREEALRFAAGLRRLGLREGEALVAQLPHCVEGAVAFAATMALGAIYVPVVHIYGVAELGHILRTAGARILVVPAAWQKFDFAGRVRELRSEGLAGEVIVTGDGDREAFGPVQRWTSLLDAPLTHSQIPTVDPGSRCVYLFTSGTTAMSKAAIHSHRTLAYEAATAGVHLRTLKHRTVFIGNPAGHVGPITNFLRQFILGIDAVHLDHWDSEAAANLIERYEAGWSPGVPFGLDALIPYAAGGRIPTFDEYIVGGTAVPPALVERADRAGIRACRSYGSTEHPTIAQAAPDEPLRLRAYTDGALLPECEIRIVDDDGRDLPPGASGEILTRGRERFLGYLEPAHNADAFTPDGKWFLTGDIGAMDADGRLTVQDRKKDVIIRGGENISSKEVEDILAHHPAVLEAAAVGWPDASYGERVGAFVRLRPGGALELDDVRRLFAASGVARQKTPERLRIVTEFPRNSAGKILKTELRRQLKDLPGT